MSKVATIWHYPRCSKSRKALALLRDEQAEITLRPYLDDPPDRQTLKAAVQQLGIPPEGLVRKKEDLYAELEVDADSMSDDDWLDLLAEHPKLIQRPVVFTDKGAVIGRPPDLILKIL